MSQNRKTFVRDATGLVRSISPLDAFFASFGFVAIQLALITYTTGPFLFPGSDLVSATILTTTLSIPIALMFTLFGWAMPRSGGDYVLISRTIHPLLGFMSSFNLMFWFLFFIGFEVNWVMTFALSPSLLIVGTVGSDQNLLNLASAVAQPQNVLLIGLIMVAIFTVVMLAGVRTSFILNNIITIISLVGVGVAIWLLVVSSRASFISSFSRFGSYDNIVSAAHNAGYSPQSSTPIIATLGVMPYIYLTTGFAFINTYYGGEIKSVKKNLFYSQVILTILSGLILTIIAVFTIQVFGYDFLGSMAYLQGTGSSQYPFSVFPFINLFLSMLTDNPLILWILAITFVATLLAAVVPSLMAVSRSIFAWSFDRVIPSKFAQIHDRFRVPVYTIIAMSIVWAASLIAYTYGPPSFLSLASGAAVGENTSVMIVSIAAIVFPFRRRSLFDPSPANIKIGPIPLLSLSGIISFAFIGMIQYFLLSNPLYGANTPPVLITIALVFLIGAVIYIASYLYHKKQGLDISMVFRDIPPE